MADISRINGIAPPGLTRDLGPVEPVAAVNRRRPEAQPRDETGVGAADSLRQAGAADPAPAASGDPEVGQDATGALERKLEGILKEVLGSDFTSRRLSIAQDEATGRFVYRVIDINTGEVLRQYPPDEILRIVARIREAEGLVLDSEA